MDSTAPLDPFPTSASSLHFPTASHNFSKTLSSLKRSTLSITNRLASIHHDSLFVHQVAQTSRLPLIANERCGSWYIPPELKAGSAYFKSTDGHQGQWSFSTRRLNLQLLGTLGGHSGCIIVDSTRRGKSMPDALTKTVPIWCTIINRLLFPDLVTAHKIFTPQGIVSASEHSQIEARIETFVEEAKLLLLDTGALRSVLKKPVRPFWVTPETFSSNLLPEFSHYIPVICCTASRRVEGAEASENGYIQGAGDDNEAWSCGLTPHVYWQHQEQLMSTDEEELPGLIQKFLKVEGAKSESNAAVLVAPAKKIYIGMSNAGPQEEFDGIIICTNQATKKEPEGVETLGHVLRLHCGSGKLGSRALRAKMPHVRAFVSSLAARNDFAKILIGCPNGNDLSVGVALALLCLYCDDEGNFVPTRPDSKPLIDKHLIRRRLAWITTVKPAANPSRSTLQAINFFLMQRPT